MRRPASTATPSEPRSSRPPSRRHSMIVDHLCNGQSMADESPACAGAIPRELYAKAILIRGVEQRLLSLFAEGRLFGTVHTCIGQEWSGIAVAQAMKDGDIIFTGHRGHGHFLAYTGDVEGLIAEVMGKQA